MVKVAIIAAQLVYGGASKFNISTAKALMSREHDVTLYTSRYNTSYSFDETKALNTVIKVGTWLPICLFGTAYDMCLNLRVLFLTCYLLITAPTKYDIIIIDRCSFPLLLLRLFARGKVMFYCHFPEKLDWARDTGMGRLYRIPLDWLESRTLGLAHIMAVNSQYTADTCLKTYRHLSRKQLQVIYPAVDYGAMLNASAAISQDKCDTTTHPTDKTTFLLFSRYDKKKNMEMVVEALDLLLKRNSSYRKRTHLVIAGAVDTVIPGTRDYFNKMTSLVEKMGLQEEVTFYSSVSDAFKLRLFQDAACLLFPPVNEHFGIVPLEIGFMGKPTIAVNHGGPVESLQDGVTGFLCEPTAMAFSRAMEKMLQNPDLFHTMGRAAKARVEQHFSFISFGDRLEQCIKQLTHM